MYNLTTLLDVVKLQWGIVRKKETIPFLFPDKDLLHLKTGENYPGIWIDLYLPINSREKPVPFTVHQCL